MDLGLKGKLAVVTGGSVGIGLAVAEGLAAEGADVLLVARDRARLDREAARLAEAQGVQVRGVVADVATPSGTDAVIAAAEITNIVTKKIRYFFKKAIA